MLNSPKNLKLIVDNKKQLLNVMSKIVNSDVKHRVIFDRLDGLRTRDPGIKSAVLYQAELPAYFEHKINDKIKIKTP